MTSGARYHLVTTCFVSSLVNFPLVFIFVVLLFTSLGFLKVFFGFIYSVDYRFRIYSGTAGAGLLSSYVGSMTSFCSIEKPTLSMPFFFLSPLYFSSELYFVTLLLNSWKVGGTATLIGSVCSISVGVSAI